MNVVIAIDSFKGSLTSLEAGQAAAEAIKAVEPQSQVHVFPVADGGEGTVDALTEGLGGEIVATEVTGPLGQVVASRYGYIPGTDAAVIEMADAAGLTMVPEYERNPMNTTTYGLGELILHAARDKGCRDFIIGIGGSATNDCGLGMLTALGVKFYREDGRPTGIFGRDLAAVERIDMSGMAPILRECRIRVACDVTNPLTGPNGCSAVYGPQKGATPAIIEQMDSYIDRFAGIAQRDLGVTGAELPGAGAAGGLGFAFHAFLGAELKPGVELVLDAIGIDGALYDADLLLTGEGRIDSQTAMGKAPVGIAELAKKRNPRVRTVAVCGCARDDATAVNDHGIDAYFPIIHQSMSVEESMEKATALRNLKQTVTQIIRLVR